MQCTGMPALTPGENGQGGIVACMGMALSSMPGQEGPCPPHCHHHGQALALQVHSHLPRSTVLSTQNRGEVLPPAQSQGWGGVGLQGRHGAGGCTCIPRVSLSMVQAAAISSSSGNWAPITNVPGWACCPTNPQRPVVGIWGVAW